MPSEGYLVEPSKLTIS